MASKEHYGLALVLGGGEVSMQEMAGLYAMLANQGVLKPLRLGTADAPADGTRLISAQASFMVMDILRQHVRPDETSGAQPIHAPIYWKTGTSWAFRDAWTAGVFGPYVLVVWVGNFDGSGNPAFIGADAAAPSSSRSSMRSRRSVPNFPSRPATSRPASNRWKSAWPAAIFPTNGARSGARPGSFPANRRSGSPACIAR